MFFETAGIEVALWVPLVVGAVLAFFCSTGGVSGAFLLLPFQMTFLGYTAPSVSATNQLYNVWGIPTGVYRYFREGRLVWPLALGVIFGTLPGVLIGSVIRVMVLPDPRHFKVFVAIVLFYIGARMVWGLVKPKMEGEAARSTEKRFRDQAGRRGRESAASTGELSTDQPVTRVIRFTPQTIEYTFLDETFRVSTAAVVGLSLVVGVVGGMYGIGGGAIMAPVFVSVFGLPVYTVAGAALLGTFTASVAAVASFALMGRLFPGESVAPDWWLGTLFGLGGMVGMYLGARCQKWVPAGVIKWMLASIILATVVKYAAGAMQ